MTRWKPWRVTVALAALLAGCGTTRWSDTTRTGTEQLLLSTAIDRAVNNINFTPLAGKEIYFDEQFLKGTLGPPPTPGAPPGPRTDDNYLASTIRQQLLAAGCILKSDRKEAAYIVEARSGAIGTNRQDVMLGVPSINLPSILTLGLLPSTIPEMPLAKTTDQKGVVKVAVCAYNQKTGEAFWQSGAFPVVATAKDSWLLGIGPWQRGSIYDGARFAGSRLIFSEDATDRQAGKPRVPVTAEAIFAEAAVADSVVKPPVETASAEPATETVSAAEPHAPPSRAAPAARILRLPAVDEREFGLAPFVVASDQEDRPQGPEDDPPAEEHDKAPRPFQPAGWPRLLQPKTWFGAPDD